MQLSVLDLVPVSAEESIAESLAGSVRLAQAAERAGWSRVWYAEHHNMPVIASSATAVVIAHIAAHTSIIRLGAGGVMLPNHSPLVIAEQFGTLESLHPGRIDLGLGRAPGTDQRTLTALRRDPRASERFPQDVQELQAYLAGKSLVPGVTAVPGAGTNVPLTILGSSLFGASLAAAFGLPYGFASHFAPDALEQAIPLYRERFQPSAQQTEPYAIAGFNAFVAPSTEQAEVLRDRVMRKRAVWFLTRGLPEGRRLTEDEIDVLLDSPQGRQVQAMGRKQGVGTGAQVLTAIQKFAEESDVDEVMVALHGETADIRVTAVELLAQARSASLV